MKIVQLYAYSHFNKGLWIKFVLTNDDSNDDDEDDHTDHYDKDWC